MEVKKIQEKKKKKKHERDWKRKTKGNCFDDGVKAQFKTKKGGKAAIEQIMLEDTEQSC